MALKAINGTDLSSQITLTDKDFIPGAVFQGERRLQQSCL